MNLRFTAWLCGLCIALFISAPSAANTDQLTIQFSYSDYLRSLETGEIMTPRYVPVPDWVNPPTTKSTGGSQPVEARIIGGNNASRGEYREYTLILITDGVSTIIGSCGGTMIASNKVLTAAHCTPENQANRYFAIPDFYSFADALTANDLFTVRQLNRHPQFNRNTADSDIAILTLSRNVSTPVAKVHAGSAKLVNKDATVIGTGLVSTNPERLVDILQEVDTPIISNAVCNDLWDQFVGIRPVTQNMVCAGFRNNGKGSCGGDSGGPLLSKIDNQRVVVGIVSFGVPECELNRSTSVYTRVGKFNNFIKSNSPQTQFVNLGDASAIPGVTLLLDEPEMEE